MQKTKSCSFEQATTMKQLRICGDSNGRLTRRRALAAILAAPVVLTGNSTSAQSTASPSSDSPDVIVIGAGAIGCNTAWHLRRRGLRVLVLEAQESPASQSTSGAAGFIASWSTIHVGNWKKTEWEMQRYGIDFYTRLAKRSKSDIGYSPCGIAYVYMTPGGWRHAKQRIVKARELGTNLEDVSANRAKELTPFLEFERLSGIAFDPDAIRIRAGDAILRWRRDWQRMVCKFGSTLAYWRSYAMAIE